MNIGLTILTREFWKGVSYVFDRYNVSGMYDDMLIEEPVKSAVIDMDVSEQMKIVAAIEGNTIKSIGVLFSVGKFATTGFEEKMPFSKHSCFEACGGELFDGMEIFIVGGNSTALKEAICLTKYAKKVVVIINEPKFSCDPSLADKVLGHARIDVHLNTEILYVNVDEKVNYVEFRNNATKKAWEYPLVSKPVKLGVFMFMELEADIGKNQKNAFDNSLAAISIEKHIKNAKENYGILPLMPRAPE